MIDVTKASRETLERLADAYHHAQDPQGSSKRQTRLEDAYRCWLDECAAPKLRTRAEVDAEIGRVLRESVEMGTDDDCLTDCEPSRFKRPADALRRLCAEPVADQGRVIDAEFPEADEPSVYDSDPDPAERKCGCPSSEQLEGVIALAIKALSQSWSDTPHVVVLLSRAIGQAPPAHIVDDAKRWTCICQELREALE